MNTYIKNATIKTIVSLALFNFIFLGTEYLFDNMMAYVTDASGVVIAQSYILGASVIGFLLFPIIYRKTKRTISYVVSFATAMILVIGIFVIQQHTAYRTVLVFGCIVFILLGAVGSAVHYMAYCVFDVATLAKSIGFAYAFGILVQFINNNLVNNDTVEAVVLAVFLTVLIVLLLTISNDVIGHDVIEYENNQTEKREEVSSMNLWSAGITLVVIVALMTCIFATLDNAVTLVHAGGSVDIGQWPRLLLAISGLGAGVLFDLADRKYMNIIMYCVTLLSTACVVVIELGGPFLIGLIVFYLSAGFFVIYFTTSFMDLAHYMKYPELWAGLGRATNNLFAIVTAAVSVSLLSSKNEMAIIIIAIVLFAAISVAIFIYTNLFKEKETSGNEQQAVEEQDDGEQKFIAFSEAFSLTPREQDVFKVLLSSDENIQDIADELFISRAALYRHIGNLNKKTQTKSRIGLLQFYYDWNKNN